MSLRVGLIGLGNMGWPMAACLLRAGHDVMVADARPDAAAAFVREVGGAAPATLGALAGAADALITMLPNSAIVETVLAEAAPALRPGSLVIDMTSGVPAQTRKLAAMVSAAGSAMIDAPVSGGVSRARTGTLAIMVGGDDAAVARARPILEAMGTTITPCGGVGAGQAMKALNNLVSAGGFLIAVEALLIGQEFGLDPGLMTDVLNASTGMNNSTQKKLRQFVLSRGFDSGFGLDLMVKDLTIALQIARDGATPAPFSAACRELWATASSLLGPGQDHTAIARLSETLAGRELSTREGEASG